MAAKVLGILVLPSSVVSTGIKKIVRMAESMTTVWRPLYLTLNVIALQLFSEISDHTNLSIVCVGGPELA